MKLNTFNRLIFLLVALFTSAELLAQTYQPIHLGMHNWNFGNGPNGISFNRISSIPTVITNKSPLGIGGSATATDPINGNLLFYTDGSNVYDACHLLMQNGSGLLGNPNANQPVAICPVPGQPNKYFIFSNSASNTSSGTVTYDVVDLSQFGNAVFPSVVPLGDLEAPFHMGLGLSGRAEAMTIVPHPNGIDFWLLTQAANSQDYSATLIDASSYNITHTGTFNTTTTSGLGLVMSASHFAYHNILKKVAVAPTTASYDAIILNFDDAAGTFVIAGESPLLNSASAGANNQAIYDIEWSGDGHYLYYSVFGDDGVGVPGNVFQFDVQNTTISLASILPSTVYRSYGLQLAPDSSIYHLYQATNGGPFLIGKISEPDSVASNVNYLPAQFGSVTNWNAMQFPALLPLTNPVITVTFTSAGTCQNAPTSFYPTVTPYADSLVWDFGDGNPTVNAWSPVYTYQDAGTFNVSVTAYLQGQPQLPPTTNPVTINAFPLQLQVTSDTTACTFEFPPPKGTSGPPQFSVTATVSGGTATSYVWSNGDTGATLTPDSAGYYYVVVTDGSGCSAYAGVNVKEYGVSDRRANVWYFGNNAGIDFTPQPALALDDGAMVAPEGCSAISDRNGDIIFYTDGDNVYDKTHALIATGIGGDPTSTQSALIIPVPGDETLYYIFTTEAKEDYPTNTIYYSLFDLKQNSGLGAVVQQKVPLFSKSTERLASNGNWLITHEYGNNSFWCFPITALGIGQPVVTSIGSDHSFKNPTLAEGYMKISPSSTVAVALSIPGTSNWIDVFDFVDSTGVLTNYRKVDLNESNGQVYGIEFSPGGNKLFATVKGSPTPSFIFEYSIDSVSQLHFKQKVTDLSELGALQVAPDGQIYFAINGSSSLGSVMVNEDTTMLSTFNFAGFALAAGTTSSLGLPSFVQSTGNAFNGPGMSVAGVCFGTPMDYLAVPTDPIDTFLWGFGDGATSSSDMGQHSYGAAGTYTVTLQINNRCLIHDGTPPYSLSQVVTIVNPPAPPTIPVTSALCTTPIQLDSNTGNVAGLTYAWSTGETKQQITVNSAGTYSVMLTDVMGCTSTGNTIMNDARPVVNLGPDRTLCEGSFVANLDTQNQSPAFTNVWTLDGVGNGNTLSVQPVSTLTPGVDTYQVTVTNVASNCQTIESVTYTITEVPNFTLVPNATTACLTPTGSIDLTIQPLTATVEPPTHLFSYFVAGTSATSAISQPVGTYNIPNLLGGIYSVLVSDDISGCLVSQSVTVNDPANTLSASNLTTCSTDPIAAVTDANSVPSVGSFTYAVFDNTGTQVDNGTRSSANFSTNPLPAGTYSLQVTRATCITGVSNIVITQNPLLTFTPTNNPCIANPTITGSAGPSYTWVGVDAASTAAIQSQTTTTLTLNNVAGTYSFNMTGDDGASCPSTQLVTITIDGITTPTIDPFDPCLNPTILSASPVVGGYTYQWYVNGTLSTTLFGSQISLGVTGTTDNYQVQIISPLTGCTYTSTPATSVRVIGPVTAALSSTAACDDGSAFAITASTNASSPVYSWFRDVGTGFSNINVTTATTSQTAAGVYRVHIDDGPCSAEATIQLIKAPLPVGGLPDRVIICDDPENADPTTDHYDLDPGVFAGYDWFIKKTETGPETSLGSTSQVFIADTKGVYRVHLLNTFGCTADDFTEVINDCVPKIVAPNAFRPASGVIPNQNFFAKTFFITDDFKVFIFNRWGELVYQSGDRFFEWNGGYNNDTGNPLPSGAYAYVIQYVSSFRPDEGVQEKRGGVMLLR